MYHKDLISNHGTSAQEEDQRTYVLLHQRDTMGRRNIKSGMAEISRQRRKDPESIRTLRTGAFCKGQFLRIWQNRSISKDKR